MQYGLAPILSAVLENLDQNGYERWKQSRRISLVVSSVAICLWLSLSLALSEDEPNGMLDLTSLLVTGRVTECLADFLGSAEQMSERVISR